MKKRTPSRKSLSPSRKGPIKAGRGTVSVSHGHGKPRFPVKRTKPRFGKGPLPPEAKRLAAKARKYALRTKSRTKFSRGYNKTYAAELRRSGVPEPEIERGLKFSITARVKRRVAIRYTRDSKGRYRVDGRFVSQRSFVSSLRMTQYWRTVRSYQSIYGLTSAEARRFYAYLRDKGFGDTFFHAVY